MDTSPALFSVTPSAKNYKLSCPLRSCSKHFKEIKEKVVLKHFKKHHSKEWFLICAHCCSFVTGKPRQMARHVKDNHDAKDLPYFCTCFSSCQLKQAKFDICQFSLQYSCTTCRYTTDSVNDFNIHVETHAGSESELSDCTPSALSTREANVSVKLEKEMGYADSQCTFIPPAPTTAKKKNSKLDHSENDWTPKLSPYESFEKTDFNAAIHPCPECGKCFTRERSIKRHMVVHTDERNFLCNLCPYQARRSGDLDIHVHTFHYQERRFTCNICFRKFAFKTNLTRHLRSHSGDKPYFCDVCNQRFSQNYNRLRHMRTYHKLYMDQVLIS